MSTRLTVMRCIIRNILNLWTWIYSCMELDLFMTRRTGIWRLVWAFTLVRLHGWRAWRDSCLISLISTKFGETIPLTQSFFGKRASLNSEFLISKKEGDFIPYGPNYLGVLKNNFWGTGFDLFDYGIDLNVEEGIIPEGFINKPKNYGKIKYETNILAEVPRAFKFYFPNPENDDEETVLENVKPKYYADRGWYCLNFYGRALTASAKNFQLIEVGDTSEDIVLMHGKEDKGIYNVDYRSPINPVQAFAISLAAIGHKRAVG